MTQQEKSHERETICSCATSSSSKNMSQYMNCKRLNEKTVKTLQEKSDLEFKVTENLYSPLLKTESTFVKDIDEFLNRKDSAYLQKKEALHKTWSQQVSTPLRRKIAEAMDRYDWRKVNQQQCQLYEHYLKFTNEKGHVFLDTLDPEDYYATAMNSYIPAIIKDQKYCKHRIHGRQQKKKEQLLQKELQKTSRLIRRMVVTPLLHDPLTSQGRQRNEEDLTALYCLMGHKYSDRDIAQIRLPMMPLVPLGRHSIDCAQWLKMPLTYIESAIHLASRKRMVGKWNKNAVNFEEWSKTPYSCTLVDQELHVLKKRQFSDVEKPYQKYNYTTIDFEAWSKTPYNHTAVDRELHIQKKHMFSEKQKAPFSKQVIRQMFHKYIQQQSISFQDPKSVAGQEPDQKSVSFQESLQEMTAL